MILGSESVDNNLRILREQKSLTQEKICEELKKVDCYLTGSAYAKYEMGMRNIPCEVLVKFAKFYGTTCDCILGL